MYRLEIFFYNRQTDFHVTILIEIGLRSYFRENGYMKICFDTPQKIEHLTTIFR